jgi:hypothetical protein
MTAVPGNIHVNISGQDKDARDVVATIVNDALTKEGFTNTAIVNSHGEPMAGVHAPSVLDVLKSRDPEFFATPVQIWADSPVAEAIVNAIVPAVVEADVTINEIDPK